MADGANLFAEEVAMKAAELAEQVQRSRCRVVGWEEAKHDEHRRVLGALAFAFDEEGVTLLCEPSLARGRYHPPDLVLIHPELGVHVIELKAVSLDQIERVEAGGMCEFQYRGGLRKKNPEGQAFNAMFAIKDATQAVLERDARVPFHAWVAFSQIEREAWVKRWGEDAWMPSHVLFQGDLELERLAESLTDVGRRAVLAKGVERCPAEDLRAVMRAFGDTAVLMGEPGEREPRKVRAGTLGERFDEAAEAYKMLTPEQHDLSKLDWSGGVGPRLVRGVAGSGKTIVLANHVARRLAHAQRQATLLDPDPPMPRLAVVCHNRTLVPLLRKKVADAFAQRTGRAMPEGAVTVTHLHGLLYHLAERGLWRHQPFSKGATGPRMNAYLADLRRRREALPDATGEMLFDAIFVDEGQDFGEAEYRLLASLCRGGDVDAKLHESEQEGGRIDRESTKGGHAQDEHTPDPSLYIFYDDAQNLFGNQRPNWKSLGLNMVGRSTVMTRCLRNPRGVVEPAFNVLYGSFAQDPQSVPTRHFGDVSTLQDKGLIEREGEAWRVRFADRKAVTPPRVTLAKGRDEETRAVVERVRWLVEDEQVRPEDVLVLAGRKQRVRELATALERAEISGVHAVHRATRDKDLRLGPRGCVTVSTIASAKGYDAYAVLLASVNEGKADRLGRASFYVGCTRAREYLEVLAYGPSPLAEEMARAVHWSGAEG